MRLPLYVLLFLFCLSFVAADFDRSAYDEPRSGFSVSDRVEVVDTAVYNTGYLSADGVDWTSFILSGERVEGSWVVGEATSSSVPSSARYFAVFSCTWSGSWDCSSTWQVLDRGSEFGVPSEFDPSIDSLQGDFEALQALYASTQASELPVLSSASELPPPSAATYPYMYLIEGEVHVLELESRGRFGEWVNIGAPWFDTTGWDTMTPQNMGEAVGVTVNEAGRVTRIDMQKVTTEFLNNRYLPKGNNLVGTLPPEIGNLKQLEYFNIKQNYFYGEIPDVFSGWQSLRKFSLAGQTQEFRVDNRIEWYEGAHVRGFNDPADPYFGRWGGLGLGKHNVVTNRFRSELPRSLGGLPELGLIEIRKQLLLGTLPESWGESTGLWGIVLSGPFTHAGANIRSRIPESWGNLTQMVFFKLEGEYQGDGWLYGEVPQGIRDWSNIANFNVPSNDLSGPIPSFDNARDIVYFNIARNSFSGEFPWLSFFNGDNSRISKFSLSNNAFSGSLPPSIAPVSYPRSHESGLYILHAFGIQNNDFSGDLPDWVTQFRGLQIINIADNRFTGPFPASLMDQQNLKTVYLHNNELSGELPDKSWGNRRIGWFYMNGNNFEGEIPDSWISLFQDADGNWHDQVSRMYFHDNDLSGRIPDWPLNLGIDYYRLDGNKYTFADIVPVYESLTAHVGSVFHVGNQQSFGSAQSHELSTGESFITSFSETSHEENVYQWERNGESIPGQTNQELSIDSVSLSDAGSYRLRVTNPRVPDIVLFSQEVELVVS